MDRNRSNIFGFDGVDLWRAMNYDLFNSGNIIKTISANMGRNKNKKSKNNKVNVQNQKPKQQANKEAKELTENVLVFDMESTLTKGIIKKVEFMGLKPKLVKWDADPGDISKIKSIIVSGCSKVVEPKKATILSEKGPIISKKYLELGIPVLGICYGHQLLGYKHGANITACNEEGFVMFKRVFPSRLFDGLGDLFPVYMKHNWRLSETPQNEWGISWKITGITEECPIASMEYEHLYGVQFHPEHWQSLFGSIVLSNFLGGICSLEVTRY